MSHGVDPMALELRPNCEGCDRDLPGGATDAMICTYECTYCADCVETLLSNVCPNCGGGFVPRPVRPAREWRDGAWLGRRPASSIVRHRPVDLERHAQLVAALGAVPPERR